MALADFFGGLTGRAKTGLSERDVMIRAKEIMDAQGGGDLQAAKAKARMQLESEAAREAKTKAGYKAGGLVRGERRMYGKETSNPLGGK